MEEALAGISAGATEVVGRLEAGLVPESEDLGRGIGLLDLQNALLRSYLAHLAFFVAWKAAGRTLEGHPVVAKLAELRVYMEKLKTVESPLTYQISKLLALASDANAGAEGGADELRQLETSARPNPQALMGLDDDLEADDADVYRPPRFAEVNLDGPEEKAAKRERRAKERMAARARQSVEVRELIEEVADLPEEIGGRPDGETPELGGDPQDDERQRYEEKNFLRLPAQSKKEQRRQRARKRESKRPDGDLAHSQVANVLALSDKVSRSSRAREKDRLVRDTEEIGAVQRGSAQKRRKRK